MAVLHKKCLMVALWWSLSCSFTFFSPIRSWKLRRFRCKFERTWMTTAGLCWTQSSLERVTHTEAPQTHWTSSLKGRTEALHKHLCSMGGGGEYTHIFVRIFLHMYKWNVSMAKNILICSTWRAPASVQSFSKSHFRLGLCARWSAPYRVAHSAPTFKYRWSMQSVDKKKASSRQQSWTSLHIFMWRICNELGTYSILLSVCMRGAAFHLIYTLKTSDYELQKQQLN